MMGRAKLGAPRDRRGRFVNWSRTVTSAPAAWRAPSSEDAIAELVRDAAGRGRGVRVVGAGHSWSPIAAPEGIAVSLDRHAGIVALAPGRVTVRGGTRLCHLGAALAERGLALPIVGSVADQSIAGAVATGTHGSSLVHGNLASLVEDMRLVTASGEVLAIGPGDERLAGARVHLGALGVVSELTLRVEPAFRLAETLENVPVERAIASLTLLARSAEYVKLWWLPHTPEAQIYRYERTTDPPSRRPSPEAERWIDETLLHRGAFQGLVALARRRPQWVGPINRALARVYLGKPRRVGPSSLLLSTPMPVRHRETEAIVPLSRAGEALERVVRLVRRDGLRVTFPVEVRFVRGDDGWLSPAFGGDVCQLGAYSSETADLEAYFAGFWREMRAMGARPHWGKETSHAAGELRPLYPAWSRFGALRAARDPGRTFSNRFLERVLGG